VVKLTPKAIRINMGITQKEMAEKIKALGVPMSERKLQEREQGNCKWTGTEIIALMTIAGIDDINVINID